MQQHFPATFSPTVKLITRIVVIVLTAILITATIVTDEPTSISYVAVYFFFLIMVITWGLHPQSYTVTPTTVIINRPFGNIKIPISKIQNATPITSEDIGIPWRIFASGGLFGYFGVFTSKNLGKHNMWCRNKDSMVLMVVDEQIIIVSPDDPAGFIAAIRKFSA